MKKWLTKDRFFAAQKESELRLILTRLSEISQKGRLIHENSPKHMKI